MSRFFPKLYKPFRRNIKVKPDLSNYATKLDIKNISHVDISSFVLKTNLACLKTEVDKLDIDKLVPVPVDLSELIFILKTYFILQNMFRSLHTSSSVVQIKSTVNIQIIRVCYNVKVSLRYNLKTFISQFSWY